MLQPNMWGGCVIYNFISNYFQLIRLTELPNRICLIEFSSKTHRAPYFPRPISPTTIPVAILF
jgi:hypothetical protein